ncbi:hypothetical protein [Bradyrhizobium sp. SZCCHNS1012]|uniref:hypothetical protein n=1 Tax=Bradyrhizobium sp. SZCCHNS1012 TaxID=3057297 RepID=UPI002916A939|nr:hypothetical protein [Bradyrhizobium sp. SZCCHNS1012]
MTDKNYNLTGNAPRELKRRGRAGTITLSDRAARFELRRGTIELPSAKAALTATVQAAAVMPAPSSAPTTEAAPAAPEAASATSQGIT